MRITRWGEFGILSCLYLARRATQFEKSAGNSSASAVPVGAADIAEHLQIPLQYAQQILHRLRKGNVIKSVRGPKGGFLLSRAPDCTTMKDILEAAEGHTFELICEIDPINPDACQQATACGLRNVWEELQSSINALLEQRTLKTLLDNPEISSRPENAKLVQISAGSMGL